MHIFVANLLKCNHLIIAAFKSITYFKKVPDTFHARFPRFDPVFIVTTVHPSPASPGICHNRFLAPVVQTLDSGIHRINHYPADKYYENELRYPLDSDLSGGLRYPTFEQPGPGEE